MFGPFLERAPAKINLALHVLGRRADGYHDLDSIVAFADVGDVLRVAPSDHFAITADGPFGGDLPSTDENIIARAWDLMTELLPGLPPVHIHLTKNLPVASGIGGGSANAAAAIRAALRIARANGIDQRVTAAALALGADVPVCLFGKACRMQGVGERITPLEHFKPLHAVLVNPRVEVSTPAVFRQLGLEKGQCFGAPISHADQPSGWRNDLAKSAIALAPVIGEVIATLESMDGVSRAGMSGSGATCFGLSDRPLALPHHQGWWAVSTILS